MDLNSNHTVERSEFRELILHMAAADLHMRQREREDEGEEVGWQGLLLHCASGGTAALP